MSIASDQAHTPRSRGGVLRMVKAWALLVGEGEQFGTARDSTRSVIVNSRFTWDGGAAQVTVDSPIPIDSHACE